MNRIVGRETVQRRGGEVISLPLAARLFDHGAHRKNPPHRTRQPLIFPFPPRQATYEKSLFHALTAAAYPFGAYVLLPAITRGVGTVGDPMGRGLSRGFAALFFMGFWTLCVLIVSLIGSKTQYGECLTSVVVNAFAIVLTTLFCQLT